MSGLQGLRPHWAGVSNAGGTRRAVRQGAITGQTASQDLRESGPGKLPTWPGEVRDLISAPGRRGLSPGTCTVSSV